MTAVGCEDGSKHIEKSHQAYNILHFSHRSRYDGRDTESCMLVAIPTRVHRKSQTDG
ncbi:MAG: hypothetical protein J6W52_06530 [Bacteroidaceae bacterium]|nr:hypothetical protein [Bacteroidaceae bacterium]